MSQFPTRRPRRATIEDVAAAAGVSMATVSRALRGLPNVALSTRERITAVAAELNYQPDQAASRLAAGRARTVTAVVPTLDSWYFSTVVAAAVAVCARHGYDVSVVVTLRDADRARLFSDETDLERRTDGLLLVEIPLDPAEAESLRDRGIRIATVGSTTTDGPSVRIDDREVGRMAAGHLAGLGHRRIGVIGGVRSETGALDVTALRLAGFVEGLDDAHLTLDETLVAGGQFGIEMGRAAMSELLDHERPPSAVFAMSDEMAFGALMELDDRGLRAGDDVSVIGVDDHEFSRVVALTTIRQHVAEHGARAAEALVAMLDGSSEPAGHVVAPIELVARATTGPPTS